jgi:hypothetical protein
MSQWWRRGGGEKAVIVSNGKGLNSVKPVLELEVQERLPHVCDSGDECKYCYCSNGIWVKMAMGEDRT